MQQVCAENGLDPMDVLITAQTGAWGGHAVSMDEHRAHALAHELQQMQQQVQQQQLHMRDMCGPERGPGSDGRW